MTATLSHGAGQSARTLTPFLHRAWAGIADLALYLPRLRRNRAQLTRLHAMNDHELQDIGLTRLDVVSAGALPPSHDPTELLASIVRERGSRRCGR
ncbi:DUF1127 domain-containing protein [Labrys wisconsinensis]|uniref:Uncharacterized protein YjiS (DUF1127 family) n=1 Tax=Labrys wisconsinensis TaxID=425677 RepID=A0ABU0JI75_9HYPH|nr:DUF1127 domain-containing protein [Labrys wisconsinensis]MDQ0473113.1 uncharacterized protein YjiS (DUF1127 family) [Labrys wisconsinensis]